MCGPYKKSSFKVLEGGSRAGSGFFPEKLSTLPAAAPAEYHIMSCSRDTVCSFSKALVPPRLFTTGQFSWKLLHCVVLIQREACQSSFEAGASVSLFLQLLVWFCFFSVSET